MVLNSIFNALCSQRLRAIEQAYSMPMAVQRTQLMRLLELSKNTCFGKKYGIAGIHSIESFQGRIPMHAYEDLQPCIERMKRGEQQVLCPSRIRWFAKSSGTTSHKSKFIPISALSLQRCHYRGIKDTLIFYLHRNPHSRLLTGKSLTLGGSHAVAAMGGSARCGDLSAILIENAPLAGRIIRSPSKKTALIPDFEHKIAAIAGEACRQNIVSFAGVPSWNLLLMKHILDYTGRSNLLEVWRNLELFIHGGISFTPYRQQYERLIPSSNMHYVETYNASEGFFALQNDPADSSMLLMLDYGIFYEFIPMTDFGSSSAQALTIADVKMDVNYAVLISTLDGLMRYVLGDTIQFTSLAPYKIKITGRTKQYINAFGEELMQHNADAAIQAACAATGAAVSDYTAAPVYMSVSEKGAHQWLIEFARQPSSLVLFAKELDAALMNINSDYEAKRHNNTTLNQPLVQELKSGTFYQWMQNRGKLGGQHKVPRLSNTREYVEQLLPYVV